MLEHLVKLMAQAQDITKQLKAENQMTRVGGMNNIRHAAKDQVFQDLISC